MFIYKVTSKENWKESQEAGFIKPLPLDIQSKFIHMCAEEHIDMIISKFWKDKADVMVLKLNPEKFEGKLVKEKNPGGNTEYYHLYDGKIPLAAVVEAVEYKSIKIAKSLTV